MSSMCVLYWNNYWPGILGPVHHVFNVVLVSHKVNAQQAGVAVRGVESLEAVTQFVLHCQASQTAAQILHEQSKRTLWFTPQSESWHAQFKNSAMLLHYHTVPPDRSGGRGETPDPGFERGLCFTPQYWPLMALAFLEWAKLKGDQLDEFTFSKKNKNYASMEIQFTNLSTTVGQVIAADNGVGNHERHDVWAGSTGPLHSDGYVCKRQGIVTHSDLPKEKTKTDQLGT